MRRTHDYEYHFENAGVLKFDSHGFEHE